MSQGDLRLHGAANFAKRSRCIDCEKAILDVSRTRPRQRCEVCRENHLTKIKKLSCDRMTRLKREAREAESEQKTT